MWGVGVGVCVVSGVDVNKHLFSHSKKKSKRVRVHCERISSELTSASRRNPSTESPPSRRNLEATALSE